MNEDTASVETPGKEITLPAPDLCRPLAYVSFARRITYFSI